MIKKISTDKWRQGGHIQEHQESYVSRDQHRREQRMMNRWTALSAFENTNLVTDLVAVDGVMA